MSKEKFPVTPAIRFLRDKGALFTHHLYNYEDKGGTAVSSRELGVDETYIIKTLIAEDENKNPLVILMHGNKEVSFKELARVTKKRSINISQPDKANKISGYLVGGTSPFGMRTSCPVYVEKTIFDLDKIYINGGKRGYLVGISPDVLNLLEPTLVEVAI